jgi:hypothetical protein
LLLGPPYKVPKDSSLCSGEVLTALRLGDSEDVAHYSSSEESKKKEIFLRTNENSGAKRLFLFSKKALSEGPPPIVPCVLQPQILDIPTEPDPSPVSSLSQSTSHHSPLHQALEVYERRFMLYLCRGRALADGASVRIASCQSCLEEQAVIAKALRAAVSNLSDHRNNATRAMAEFTAEFQQKIKKHSDMLTGLEGLFATLHDEPLHPSLVTIAKRSGRSLETLADCIPIDKYRAWANQCQLSNDKLIAIFSELQNSYQQVGNPDKWKHEISDDDTAENQIKALYEEVESQGLNIIKNQMHRLDQLTKFHGDVVSVIMSVISGGGTTFSKSPGAAAGISGAQSAFSTLEIMAHESTDILPSMEADDDLLKETMAKVGDAKTLLMEWSQKRLRQISMAQSAIQRVISGLSLLKDSVAQVSANMESIQHVFEFHSSYKDFLSEVRRRRAFNHAITSIVEAMMERIATLRIEEVRARERFLRTSGRHLMPAFYETFAPTLASPPPMFVPPQMTSTIEMDSLPDVGEYSDILVGRVSSLTISAEHKVSVVAADEEQHAVESSPHEAAAVTSAPVGHSSSGGLIVSADEGHTTDEIMGDDNEQQAVANAERKLLLYENSVLRQAVERLGGKAPRAYVKEAQDSIQEERQNVLKEKATLEEKIQVVEKELAATKSKLDKTQSSLSRAKKKNSQSDKISFTSFEVGDIGLFMPTGRGKKSYVAFHSNSPHRYLSSESVTGNPDYILGRIVFQEEHTAHGSPGLESNPYGLPPGTRFWVLTVEIFNK